MTNETLKVLETRRSCRKFKPDMITDEELDAVLRAGTFAPTGMGRQSPIIIAVKDKKLRDELSAVNATFTPSGPNGTDPFYGAPVILIVLADKSRPTHVYDGSLVMGNLLNAAASLGLGSIWIHRAREEFESEFGKNLLKRLGIEGDYEGIGHCALGYAAAEPAKAAERKADYIYKI
ncbi:MAG: nitroreductase [Mailhella sp.]|nr:nitroreductase [Mailhella sp.]